MKIEKLPSGSYRIRKMYKGNTYTVIFDSKPTQKEAVQAMAAEMDKSKSKSSNITFKSAAKSYIDMKRNVLSPRTVKEYSETINRFPDWFCNIAASDITQIEINRLINEFSEKKSPKTVRNYHGFMTAVLGTFCPNLKITPHCRRKLNQKLTHPRRKM